MSTPDKQLLTVITGGVLTHGIGAYCASKAATNTYMEMLQEENASNVHIMLANPPMVKTPLINQALEGGPQSLRQSADSGSNMVTPELIVDAINRGIAQVTGWSTPGTLAQWCACAAFSRGFCGG